MRLRLRLRLRLRKARRKDLRCAPESRRQILSCEAAVTAQSAGRGSSPCMQSQAVQSDAHFRAHRRRHFEAADVRMCGVLLRTSDILLRCGSSASDFAFSSPLLCNAMDRCLSLAYFALDSRLAWRTATADQADASQRQEILQEQQQRRDLQNASSAKSRRSFERFHQSPEPLTATG